MFKKKKETPLTDDYSVAVETGNGVGGYGLDLPKDKQCARMGWWCPSCEKVYEPSISECSECNKKLKEQK